MSQTLSAFFIQTVERQSNQVAVTHFARNRWVQRSWNDYFKMVERTACALHDMGIKPGSRVAIISNTRLEWAVCDLAILGLGAVTVPIYQNSTPEDLEYILNNSGAEFLFCEDGKSFEKFKSIKAACPQIRQVVSFEKTRDKELICWSEFHQLGSGCPTRGSEFFKKCSLERKLDEVATLMYTSGTTGKPKGVVLTHEQIMSEIGEVIPSIGLNSSDTTLSFLPYAHVMGRIEMWAHAFAGFTMGFARSIEHMREDMKTVRPTAVIAVPRLFEKIYVGILTQVENSKPKAKLFRWALSVGRIISRAQIEKRQPTVAQLLQYQLAKRLVFGKVHDGLGGRLRFAVCGGAPLSQEIGEFFHAVGVLVLEGYGLTETTAAVCLNTPFEFRFGSVGKPVGETKVRVAEDGEILVQSKKVMREYYQNPEATAEAIKDGWFYTGDIGHVTDDGFVCITDRKKELIKTAGGKYVAPQKLENMLKTSKYISQAYVHGDRRKFVVALITLNADTVKQYAASAGIAATDMAVLSQHPHVRELIRIEIHAANQQLANFETIKNFALLPAEFSLETGELTPSMKIKRKVIEGKFKEILDLLYS